MAYATIAVPYALMIGETPNQQGYQKITEFRKTVLATAFMAHPERFLKGQPIPSVVPNTA